MDAIATPCSAKLIGALTDLEVVLSTDGKGIFSIHGPSTEQTVTLAGDGSPFPFVLYGKTWSDGMNDGLVQAKFEGAVAGKTPYTVWHVEADLEVVATGVYSLQQDASDATIMIYDVNHNTTAVEITATPHLFPIGVSPTTSMVLGIKQQASGEHRASYSNPSKVGYSKTNYGGQAVAVPNEIVSSYLLNGPISDSVGEFHLPFYDRGATVPITGIASCFTVDTPTQQALKAPRNGNLGFSYSHLRIQLTDQFQTYAILADSGLTGAKYIALSQKDWHLNADSGAMGPMVPDVSEPSGTPTTALVDTKWGNAALQNLIPPKAELNAATTNFWPEPVDE